MSKVLVTGATGFIGRTCIHLLKNSEFEIHALYRNKSYDIISSNVVWHQCDILNLNQASSIIKKIRPDYLIHLAWFVEHKLFWTHEENIPYIAASIHLYKEFTYHHGKKALFLGTCAEYDSSYSNCNEDTTPLIPNTVYGMAKNQTYKLLTELKEDYSPFCWVRLFNIFGLYENPNRLVPYIFNSYLQNKSPIINNPDTVRNYLFADNLAQFLVHLLQNNTEGAINIGQDPSLSIKALAHKIHTRYFNHSPRPEYNSAGNEDDIFIPNLDKFNKLNLRFNYSLDQGLDKTYQWWLHNSGIKQ